MKVFKYPISRTPNEYGIYHVEMPSDSQILSTAVVGNEVVIYGTTSGHDADMIRRPICLLGTGKEMPETKPAKHWKFLGTVIQGVFVWHVFH